MKKTLKEILLDLAHSTLEYIISCDIKLVNLTADFTNRGFSLSHHLRHRSREEINSGKTLTQIRKEHLTKTYENNQPLYDTILHHKVGNCGEVAALAFEFLRKELAQNKLSIQLEFLSGVKPFDHAMLLLNRTQPVGSKFYLTSLTEQSIIIDPWLRCVFHPTKSFIYYAHMANIYQWGNPYSLEVSVEYSYKYATMYHQASKPYPLDNFNFL